MIVKEDYTSNTIALKDILKTRGYIFFIKILKYIIQISGTKKSIYRRKLYGILNLEEEKTNIKKFIKWFFKQSRDNIPLFDYIELETINRCNGICPFCPVNRKEDKRKFKLMKENLFESIIKQLKKLNYDGTLSLFSNNEPFLDKRIIKFAKVARENLPYTYIMLYTNGTLLTLDKFISIIPYLDRMVIDNYNDNLRLNKNVKEIYDYCKRNEILNNKVEIHLRKLHVVLTTRGGQSPNNHKKRTLHISCLLPFRQIVIRPDGKISLCCNDALGKFTMGDLNKQSLLEIWFSKKYRNIRYRLKHGRKNISLCKYCDSLIYYDFPKRKYINK